MSGDGVKCIGEGELVGQVDPAVQCEELEVHQQALRRPTRSSSPVTK
jgi:hypothetical protein